MLISCFCEIWSKRWEEEEIQAWGGNLGNSNDILETCTQNALLSTKSWSVLTTLFIHVHPFCFGYCAGKTVRGNLSLRRKSSIQDSAAEVKKQLMVHGGNRKQTGREDNSNPKEDSMVMTNYRFKMTNATWPNHLQSPAWSNTFYTCRACNGGVVVWVCLIVWNSKQKFKSFERNCAPGQRLEDSVSNA